MPKLTTMNVRRTLHELVGHFKPFFPQQQYQAKPEKNTTCQVAKVTRQEQLFMRIPSPPPGQSVQFLMGLTAHRGSATKILTK